MMGFEEFRDQVMAQLPNFLPSGMEVEISPTKIVKNNGRVKQGICIHQKGSNIGPVIYLDDDYQKYYDGQNMSIILNRISRIYMEEMEHMQLDVSWLHDYNRVKDRLYCTLVNKENNAEFLKDKPYTQVEDLAVIYQVFVGEGASGLATAIVTDQMMEQFKIDKETLHRDAMENTQRMFPTEIVNIRDVLWESNEMDESPELQVLWQSIPRMYILTNVQKKDGAAGILNPVVMDQIAAQIGEDIYVIPSSVHELILVPKLPNMNRRAVEEMIHEVNGDMLYPEEILSEHAYGVDFKEHRLYRCDLEEQRIKERELEAVSEEKKAEPEPEMEKKAVRRKPEQRGPKM